MKTPVQIVLGMFKGDSEKGVNATARALNITPGAVSRWGGKVPQQHHEALLRLAKGMRKRLTANDLIFGRR